jgi:cysteinyl-tRNA synthetase
MSEPIPGLKLFNTLSGMLENFVPLDAAGKQVKMYVCGPTVYDDAHLGHARCYITWDVLYRFLKFLGYQVRYVRNVTDVDDKILNRAKERGETPAQLAERNYLSFSQDMQALNVLPPDEEPRATQYISHMLQGIGVLIEQGAAYASPDGSVYFRVAAKKDYGKLSKKPLNELKSVARVEADPNKESPLDFALWKAVPLSDANGWETSWPAEGQSKGWGRPGWHMECSAMNHAVFGDQIDIHAGGADLIFPHHENEIAQSEAWTGHAPFSKYWMHNGFVNVSGSKMSKSLGNFATIKTILERYDANTIRYFLLTNHYRMPVDFSDESLQAAENWVVKAKRALNEAKNALGLEGNAVQQLVLPNFMALQALPKTPDTANFLSLCLDMMEDLNNPKALAKFNITLGHLRGGAMPGGSASETPVSADLADSFKVAVSMLNLLGFDLTLLFNEDSAKAALPIDEILQLIQARKQAKEAKDWPQADAIRNQITEMGLKILDNKDGTTSVEKDGLEVARA